VFEEELLDSSEEELLDSSEEELLELSTFPPHSGPL
jgi:hypothetical protein